MSRIGAVHSRAYGGGDHVANAVGMCSVSWKKPPSGFERDLRPFLLLTISHQCLYVTWYVS
jgi:hypothetical protein